MAGYDVLVRYGDWVVRCVISRQSTPEQEQVQRVLAHTLPGTLVGSMSLP
jgi:hypothetical protein